MSKNFETVFRDKLDEIEERAREAGINMSVICREAGIGRATPDRWKRQIPKTIKLVAEMERVVEEREEFLTKGTIPGEID